MVAVWKRYVDQCGQAFSSTALFAQHQPFIHFRDAADRCPNCGGRLYVVNSHKREVVTLHLGAFLAHETLRRCGHCDVGRFRSSELAQLVPEGGNFGYDVIGFVGRSLFVEHRTALETVTALANQNVTISESAVRELAARFIAYLSVAHLEAGPALRKLFALNGGYILHLDSTSRRHSRKLLSGIDELTGLVLLNVKLCTETANDVADFLREIVDRYGPPLAVACDMAMAIRSALRDILPNVPVYICHFHFLRDAGKDLINDDYRKFVARFDSHQISKKLRRLEQQFSPYLKSHAETIETFLNAIDASSSEQINKDVPYEGLLAGMVCSGLEAQRQGDGLGFPFDRCTLNFYNHLLVLGKTVKVLFKQTSCPKNQKLAQKLLKPLLALQADKKLAGLARDISDKTKLFDDLRCALRIAEPGANAGLHDQGSPIDIPPVKHAVKALRDQLDADKETLPREVIKLIEQIDRHWDDLFREPLQVITSDGTSLTILPQRTNNIMEHFFRDYGRNERRRTGIDFSARRLNAMLPDTPLMCNLKNTAYLKILLGDCTTLEQRFSRIDISLVRDSLVAARSAGKVFLKPRKVRKLLRRISTPYHFAIEGLKQAIKRLENQTTCP